MCGFQGNRAARPAGPKVSSSCRKEKGRAHPSLPPSSRVSWEDEGRACDKPVADTGVAAWCSVNAWFPAPRPDTRPVAASEELGRDAQESGVRLSDDHGYLGEVDTVPHRELHASLSTFAVFPSTGRSCLPPPLPRALHPAG